VYFSKYKKILNPNILNQNQEIEKLKHKSKRIIPSPDSFFMDVKCPVCQTMSIVFSHSQTTVTCNSCKKIICNPSGGKAKLVEGTLYIKK
jgi:small subunit ribosomal protein S27e